MNRILLSLILMCFITIANAQVTETADVITPGTLNTVAKEYLNTVTNLTVTGSIDARDFKTMRDSMPVLSVVNLSSATIAEYEGTNGTQDANNDTYPANTIPQYAFYQQTITYNTTLTSINFPTNITAIGAYAFYLCSELTGSLTIPSSVTAIGACAFYNCDELTGSLNIPSSVTSIGDSAFYYCNRLMGSLNISNSITSIGVNAFFHCSGFTGSLIIPSSVTFIGEGAFALCNGLIGFNVNETNPSYCSVNGVLFNITKKTLFEYPAGLTGTYTIPSTVDSIESYAFYYCSNLTGSLTIPTSVTYIGLESFYWCTSLTGSLTIPSSVTYIGRAAFSGCMGFKGTLTIPTSVTYIGIAAFFDCYYLTSIIDLNTVPLTGTAMGSDVFTGVLPTINLYVPCGSVNTYEVAMQWNNFNVVANNRFVPISASADNIKSGTSVTFTANTSCISASATLQWQVNGKNKGTNDTLIYIPVNCDTVTCNTIINDTVVTSNAIVMNVTSGTGVIDVTQSDVSLYPIPVIENLTISCPNVFGQTSISIYNLNGIEVYSLFITSSITTMDMSKYSSGVYIVKILTLDNGIITKKIIKQ